MEFTQEELSRYNRQMMMDRWGQETQERIKNSTVFIAGAARRSFQCLVRLRGLSETLQAMEALTYLSSIGKVLKGRLLVWSGNDMSFRTYRGFRDPDCPACGAQQ